MNIIIPMAGRGTRLRPHTLSTPKPLIKIAGKTIVQRLCEEIRGIYKGKIDQIGFVVGDFGEKVEKELLDIAKSLGANGQIYYQMEPLGTAHAIWQALPCLEGEVVIAFADTLFKADFQPDRNVDGAIWVKTVENPSQFGVVTLNEKGLINGMVEKPTEFVSDLAIIGIYYIKDGQKLASEIRHILENDLKEKGEFQLTNALENMRLKGASFSPGKVVEWMDCGNREAVLDTMKKTLEFDFTAGKKLISDSFINNNSMIISPCHIGENVVLENSIIGPFVSLGDNTTVRNSVLSKTLTQSSCLIENQVLEHSMLGSHVVLTGKPNTLDLGDYSKILD